MLYQPREVLNLRTQWFGAIISTFVRYFADYLAAENEPWYYYAGVLLGELVAATGIPAASATIYVVATVAKFKVEHSENGGQIGVFLDGVRIATHDSYGVDVIWDLIEVALPDLTEHRIDLVLEDNPNEDKTSTVNWMSLGVVEILGGYALRSQNLMSDIVSFTMKDAEQDTQTTSVAVYFPSGLWTYDQYRIWAQSFCDELDAASGSQITEINVTMAIALPVAGIKTEPTALYNNERGGLISFDTSGDRAESFRIPAILASIMPGREFSLADPLISPIVARLTTPTTAANMRPKTPFGYDYEDAVKAVKSNRKR